MVPNGPPIQTSNAKIDTWTPYFHCFGGSTPLPHRRHDRLAAGGRAAAAAVQLLHGGAGHRGLRIASTEGALSAARGQS